MSTLATDAGYKPKKVTAPTLNALLKSPKGRDELVNWIQSTYLGACRAVKNNKDLRKLLEELLGREVTNNEFARFNLAFHRTGKASFKSRNRKRNRQFPRRRRSDAEASLAEAKICGGVRQPAASEPGATEQATFCDLPCHRQCMVEERLR